MRSTDRLSLVTYGTDVTVLFGLTPMTPSNKRDKKIVINSLGISGSTNLCEGLLSGNLHTNILFSLKLALSIYIYIIYIVYTYISVSPKGW